MYDKAKGKSLDDLARKLLSRTEVDVSVKDTLEELKKVINYNDWRYYVMDDPLLADQEYDRLFAWLKDLESKYPELVTNDSPTQRVAKGLNSVFPTVDHQVPMLSLGNSYNAEDLRDWDKRNRDALGDNPIEYCVEPKFDGAGVSLIYENNLLTRGATRGDGVQGEDITSNIKQIRSVPLSARLSDLGITQMEIRGEAIMSKKAFERFNEVRAQRKQTLLANPRNAASGSLRMIDPNEVKKRNLEVFLYHVSYLELGDDTDLERPKLRTQSSILRGLAQIGFRTPINWIKVFSEMEEVIDYCKSFELERDHLPFEIDGLVVKVNSFQLQEQLGSTSHHPRWAMAYKFKARQASSKLRRVEFQVGRTGTITPVAKIDPVPLAGVTISSISLFNEDVVREKDVRIGDMVLVERAGDVIPYIVKPLVDLRDGSETAIIFPDNCPVCGDPLERAEGESAWRCVNINCKAQVVERLIHFGSKDAMDIQNLGEANVKRFFELGLLEDIPGIYNLDFEKIGQLEGFGKKSVDNLRKAIEQSKNRPLHRLVFALGIRFVGVTTAKTIAHSINDLMELRDKEEEELMALEDIGPKVASAIFQFFHNVDNLLMLEKLRFLGLNMSSQEKQSSSTGGLTGLSFLFTGTLSMKRSDAEAMAESYGGKILKSVSSKLNYLVVGENAGSKLAKAKKLNSVRIIDENTFLKMVEEANS